MLNAAPVNTVSTEVQRAIADQPFEFTAYRGKPICIADVTAAVVSLTPGPPDSSAR